MNKLKARVRQFFHCLSGYIKLQPHQAVKITENRDEIQTYLYLGCSCGESFLEEGKQDDDDMEELMNIVRGRNRHDK